MLDHPVLCHLLLCASLHRLILIFVAVQHSIYNRSPLGDLASHLQDPWNNNYATNGISIPFLPPK